MRFRRGVRPQLADVDGARSHCDAVQPSRVQVGPGGRPRSQTVGFHSRLPDDVTSATALLTFRRKLKARLFRQSYLAYFHLEHTRTHTPV